MPRRPCRSFRCQFSKSLPHRGTPSHLARRVARLDSRVSALEAACSASGGAGAYPDLADRMHESPPTSLTEGLSGGFLSSEPGLGSPGAHFPRFLQCPPPASACATPTGTPTATPSPSRPVRGSPVGPHDDLQAAIHTDPPRTTFCSRKVCISSPARWDRDQLPRLDLRAVAVVDGQNGGFVGIAVPTGPLTSRARSSSGGSSSTSATLTPRLGHPDRRASRLADPRYRLQEDFDAGVAIRARARGCAGLHAHDGRDRFVVTTPCDAVPARKGS